MRRTALNKPAWKFDFVCTRGSRPQFIGVDKNGRDVYEGDTIKPVHAADDMAFKATHRDYGAIFDGRAIKCV